LELLVESMQVRQQAGKQQVLDTGALLMLKQTTDAAAAMQQPGNVLTATDAQDWLPLLLPLLQLLLLLLLLLLPDKATPG
jgi:hypothetical protein